ncbi:hypothetical protein LC724_30755 [Blautia sp. RD014234]|nr:hypothetical protein [Blautia parvula]
METSTVSRIFRLAESPRNRAVTKQIENLCHCHGNQRKCISGYKIT